MRTIIVLFLFLGIATSIPAQNPFDFKGKIFGYIGSGYRAPLKKYFRGELLDDMLSLKNNSIVIDVTHYYFIRNKWGVFLNMAFAPSRPKNRTNSDQQRWARYEKDYYFDNLRSAQPRNTDDRFVLGGAYRIEKGRWRFFTSLGLGITQFDAAEDFRILKEKNSNVNNKAELLWSNDVSGPNMPTTLLGTAGVLSGFRLTKRFTAVVNLTMSHFATKFEYHLQRSNQFTKEKFIDDIYSYKRSSVDIMASAGIMFTPSVDRPFSR
ncbi:MAG TPA: hypothetical protein VL943_01370 [Niabella sp.]|nr:hypothetical protein [Niabella sp.]